MTTGFVTVHVAANFIPESMLMTVGVLNLSKDNSLLLEIDKTSTIVLKTSIIVAINFKLFMSGLWSEK